MPVFASQRPSTMPRPRPPGIATLPFSYIQAQYDDGVSIWAVFRYDSVDAPGYSFSRRWRARSLSAPAPDLPSVLRTGREGASPFWRRQDRAERSNGRTATV